MRKLLQQSTELCNKLNKAEVKVVDKAIETISKKAATKKRVLKSPPVMDSNNEYLKLCKSKQKRNAEMLDKVICEIKKGKAKTPPKQVRKAKTPPKQQNKNEKVKGKPRKLHIKEPEKPKKRMKKKCQCCHNLPIDFKIEQDRRYSFEGYYLHGVKCAGCKIEFGEDKYRISQSQPVYVCNNRIKFGCTHLLCAVCFTNKLIDKEKDEGVQRSSQRTRNN